MCELGLHHCGLLSPLRWCFYAAKAPFLNHWNNFDPSQRCDSSGGGGSDQLALADKMSELTNAGLPPNARLCAHI